ncbi:hypothetical protein Tdes44962_MAKER04767 [Teratosphaeria destructans]|uniref:Antifungal protein n=1 Tax=Teratosphaeria destructans TaxID=418781 RepID=A0A9W7SLF6_9PEZI|nr:hypothetical protein Tdes44962_MAKER04767 [Teratosphaeria destructans]
MKAVTLLATLFAPLAIASAGNGICRPNDHEYNVLGFRDQPCAPSNPCKVDKNGCKFSRKRVPVGEKVEEWQANCS